MILLAVFPVCAWREFCNLPGKLIEFSKSGGLGATKKFLCAIPFCRDWHSCSGPWNCEREPSEARRTGL